MILTKEFLEKLIPVFTQELVSEETELNYEEHHFDAKLDKNEDDELTIVIKYRREESLRDQFMKWCEQVDDDIFIKACEQFEELTGRPLSEVEEEELYDLFKTVVQEIVKSKIEDLHKKYLGD